MATNQYFSSNYFASSTDQVLTENLMIEAIKIYGIDVKYLPRNLVDYDKIYGEDDSSSFDDYYTVEMYVKNIDGFQGDGQFLSKFGIEIRDEMTFSVARKRFIQEVSTNEPDVSRPRRCSSLGRPHCSQGPLDPDRERFSAERVRPPASRRRGDVSRSPS